MLKKFARLLSRNSPIPALEPEPAASLPVETDVTFVERDEADHRVFMALQHLSQPYHEDDQRDMSDRAVRELGEDPCALLTRIHLELKDSAWDVVWLQGAIRFVHMAAPWKRHEDLLESVRIVSAEYHDEFAERYIFGLCTAFLEVDAWLKERVDPEIVQRMLTAEEALQSALADDWEFEVNQPQSKFACLVRRPVRAKPKIDAELPAFPIFATVH